MNIADKKRLDEICSKARQRKEKILNSPSDYPSDAERYFYIDSIDGDDAKDGRTPETAWRSAEKIIHTPLQKGDVVLFRRGGLWRGTIPMQAGVHYSAYGEGEKPKIYGSQNAANPEDWVETKYKNVWMYRPLLPYVRDVGCVIINDGALWGIKVCKNKKEGVRCDGKHDVFNGRTTFSRERSPFTDFRDLKNDLEFYHNYDDEHLYLYCADGNPGEVFDDIELSLRKGLFTGRARDIVVDNLCLKYVGIHALSHSGHDVTIQNCEISWIGGSNQFPEHEMMGWPKPFGDDTTRLGNGAEVYGGCDNYVIKDCYFSQIYDAAMTAQFMNANVNRDVIMKNIDWHGNLIDCCHYCFELWLAIQNAAEGVRVEMKDAQIYDNICLNNGYGWGHQRPDAGYAFFYGDPQKTVCQFSNVEFRDNIFLNGRGVISNARMFRKGNGMHFLRNEIYHAGTKIARHCKDLAGCTGGWDDFKNYEATDEDINLLIDGKCWEDCKYYKFEKDETISEPYFKI
ncbi:MAG: hypothetical protein U0K54_01215 [Acutalibacteraceae bacterium]|nr:hypothetical protein [Acutalibacteraceae bacterium]